MIAAILSLGGIGLVSAVALGVAAKRFAVEVDPRELALLELLPGVNCGACGFAGCTGYAKALVKGEVTPDLCPPGGREVAARLANILGVSVTMAEPQLAVVFCQGDAQKAREKYRYLGVADCVIAQRLADGPKSCPGGCLGLGSCERACPFGAIEMTAAGLAVISRERCTGCRKCVAACPRQVIRMTPASATVHVLCNSHDAGALVRKYCTIGCIACQICVKTAPEAYRVEDRLATAIYGGVQGEEALQGLARCPTHCIRDFSTGYPEGATFPAPSPGAS